MEVLVKRTGNQGENATSCTDHALLLFLSSLLAAVPVGRVLVIVAAGKPEGRLLADRCRRTQRYAQRWTASAVSLGFVLKQILAPGAAR